MKIIPSTLFFLFVFTATSSFSQNSIIGTWKGKIAGQVRLIFHLDTTKQGKLFGTLDSPDQGVTGLQLSTVSFTGDSLAVEIDVAHARYHAGFTSDTTLSGTWIQGLAKIPFQVTRESTKSNIILPKRPQTPVPPFSYNSLDVEYDNTDKTVHFGATLTFPKTGGPFPVAVMITGSGLQDRDETIFYHKPFAVIADYLTKRGYAVLRVDDRTMGKSTGEVQHATSADFAQDVMAGIQFLKTRTEIDSNKIGLIGHSEGGIIAPIVYSQYPHLKFIISLAGSGISGAEILLLQQTEPLKQTDISKPVFTAFYNLTKSTLFYIHDHSGERDSLILKNLKLLYQEWKNAQPDSIVTLLNEKGINNALFNKQIAVELQDWFKFFIATDPSLYWQKVKCPVLALNGSKDLQVYPDQNTQAISLALKKVGNKKYSIQIIPDLNHLFQHCKTCTLSEYGELEETFAPEALDIMGKWLKENVH